jgi:N6-adenosine-specific RNA methylase IME4
LPSQKAAKPVAAVTVDGLRGIDLPGRLIVPTAIPERCSRQVIGWELPADLSEAEWCAAGQMLGRIEHSVSWWIGDWWAFGEASYGERKAIVAADDWDGPAYQTCRNAASVAGKFELSRRRDDLSFAHHAEVAALPPDKADRLLDWAEETIDATGKPRTIAALRTAVRASVRAQKKADYFRRIADARPKPLDGKYRVFLADPPWRYHGLNQADEYGHAERHYECLDDNQLCAFKPDGIRLIKDLAEKNAVLFLWVTAPMLERAFPIIEAWGFTYKTLFVWDKVRHNVGYYNSVRAELLLICTRGACRPDVPRLIDSVQSIERSEHSEKPEEFRKIIEGMYDHGRKLELFARAPRPGWDAVGNEIFSIQDAA